MIDRKALIKQYKQTVQPMGVFRIVNTATGKIFIGSGKNLPAILNSQKFQLNADRHPNRELQKDFSRLGKEAFTFEAVDYLEPEDDPGYDYSEDLKVFEEMWLEKLQPYGEHGYNKKKVKT